MKKNVDQVEESVITAEKELGSHTIQKVLGSIPGLRQASNPLFVAFFGCQQLIENSLCFIISLISSFNN